MDAQLHQLLARVWTLYSQCPGDRRVLVGISGIPGSGKTTLAGKLVALINDGAKEHDLKPSGCHLLSLDGFHLTRAELDGLPDPAVARARRGAAFTFNAPGFLTLVKRLREPINADTKTVLAPSFDHATKDPVLDDVQIPPDCRIVLLEGNYLSLGSGAIEWRQAAELMDELWFVEVAEDVARKRLVKRHLAAGIAQTEEAALKRAEENDLLNGREIVEGRMRVDVVVDGGS